MSMDAPHEEGEERTYAAVGCCLLRLGVGCYKLMLSFYPIGRRKVRG